MVQWEPIEALSKAGDTIDLDAESAFTDTTDDDTVSALTEPKFDDFDDNINDQHNVKNSTPKQGKGCTSVKSTSDLVSETIQDANEAFNVFLISINSPPFNMNKRLSSAATNVKATASRLGTSVKTGIEEKVAEREERKREKLRLKEIEEEIRLEKRRMKYMQGVRDECTDVANLWRIK